MSSDSRFIAGIHNYCDRWCERCRFPARCRVFHETERDRRCHVRRGEDPQAGQAVADDVGRALAKAHRLLARFARREGVSLDELAQAEPGSGRKRDGRLEAEPVVRLADRFMEGCHGLLEELRSAFGEAADDVGHRAGFMDVAGEASGLGDVRDSYEVICWDHTLVAVKVRRAVDSLRQADGEDDPDMRRVKLDDAAGSAAVARRSLQRSQAALLMIYHWDESLRDAAIELLAAAERLTRALERELPGCLTFQWPPPEAGPPNPDASGLRTPADGQVH